MSLSNIFKLVLLVCNFLVLITCPFSLSFWYITSYEVTFGCASHDIVILSSWRLVDVSKVFIVGIFISGFGTSLYTLFKNSILAISDIFLFPLLAVTFIEICLTATWVPKSITISPFEPFERASLEFSLNSTVFVTPFSSTYVILPFSGIDASELLEVLGALITICSISIEFSDAKAIPSLLPLIDLDKSIPSTNGDSSLGACPSFFPKDTDFSLSINISLILVPLSSLNLLSSTLMLFTSIIASVFSITALPWVAPILEFI